MRWPQKSQGVLLRAASTLSLTILCTCCLAGPYTDLDREIKNAKTPQQIIDVVRASGRLSKQEDIKARLESASSEDQKTVADDLKAMIEMGAAGEQKSSSTVNQGDAATIKESPIYRDQGFDRRNNWLSNALRRLDNIRFKPKVDTPRTGSLALSGLGNFVTYFLWTALIIGVLTMLFYTVRYIDWRNALTRKARTLLEDDEPLRTLDQWLELAEEHALAGRYREAVRALYLACLLKFDEHNVARFDRGETNWEHLARIQSSPRLPAGTDFTAATQRFDRVWYGYQVKGQEDVDLFRSWYQQITASLRVPA